MEGFKTMRAQAEIVSLKQVAALKRSLRQADERRLALGVPAERVARENALIAPSVVREARIKSVGRRFPRSAFAV